MATRAEIVAAVRARYNAADDLAMGLVPEVERLVEEYILMLEPVLGTDVRDPEIRALIRQEVAALAFEAALTRTEEMEKAQELQHGTVEETEPAGYVYLGPDEDVIAPGGYNLPRPFCNALVEHWLTREEINRLNNQQQPNAWLTRGGYNCRHGWFPLYGDEVDEFPRGNVDEANAAALRAR